MAFVLLLFEPLAVPSTPQYARRKTVSCEFRSSLCRLGSGPTKLTVSITTPLYPRKRTLEEGQDDPPACRRRCSQYRRTLSSSWNKPPEPWEPLAYPQRATGSPIG